MAQAGAQGRGIPVSEYTNRRIETIEVARTRHVEYLDAPDTPYLEISTKGHSGFVQPIVGGMEHILPDDVLELETRGFSLVTGLRRPGGEWFFHKSDEDLAAEQAERTASFRRQNEERWERDREDWTAREAALPDDLRERLEFFRERGGHEFEVEGWAYELIICELAVLYRQAGVDDEGNLIDSPEVEEYAAKEGTSGNQHGMAKLLVTASNPSRGMEPVPPKDVPSALTPLGGTRDYGPKKGGVNG